jgi:hypothetical protein
VYAWLPLLLLYLGYRIVRWWRRRRLESRKVTAGFRLRQITNFAGALFFLFHILWGFNYLHNPLKARLPREKPPLSAEELCLEAEWTLRNAEAARARIAGAGLDSLHLDHLPDDYPVRVEAALTALLDSLQLPQARAATPREIHPRGSLLRVGIGGIYNPFSGEGNIDAGVITALKPEVLGHEMSHGKGYTDEGTCNFLGMLACMTASHPAIRYSGYLAYYLYVAGDLHQADPQLQQMVRATLDPGPAADLHAYRNNHKRYRGWMSRVGETVNHAYLSTQGISGGITNYGKVVAYMTAFQVSRHVGVGRR